MVFGAVIFLGLMLAYLVIWGRSDNELQRNFVDNGLWALAALVGIYIGAPVADDWLQSRKR